VWFSAGAAKSGPERAPDGARLLAGDVEGVGQTDNIWQTPSPKIPKLDGSNSGQTSPKVQQY